MGYSAAEQAAKKRRVRALKAINTRWDRHRELMAAQGITAEDRRQELLRLNRDRVRRFRKRHAA